MVLRKEPMTEPSPLMAKLLQQVAQITLGMWLESRLTDAGSTTYSFILWHSNEHSNSFYDRIFILITRVELPMKQHPGGLRN